MKEISIRVTLTDREIVNISQQDFDDDKHHIEIIECHTSKLMQKDKISIESHQKISRIVNGKPVVFILLESQLEGLSKDDIISEVLRWSSEGKLNESALKKVFNYIVSNNEI